MQNQKLLILIVLAVDKENANAGSKSRIPASGITSNSTYKKKQALTVKLKDSIVKTVEGKKLGQKVQQIIVVRSFLGAKVKYYRKPVLNNNSDHVIVHC